MQRLIFGYIFICKIKAINVENRGISTPWRSISCQSGFIGILFLFFLCVYSVVYMCVYVQVCMWRPEFAFLSHFPHYILRQSFTEPTGHWFGQLAPGILLVPTTHTMFGILGGSPPCLPNIYMDAGHPDSSSHTRLASTLLTEPSP